MSSLDEKLSKVRLIAMDVDGVLTDGSMIFGVGEETKIFHVHDGLGISVAIVAGIEIVWISGNVSDAVAKRAEMLGIREVRQGVGDKGAVISQLIESRGLSKDEVAFIGDDLNDLPAFEAAGVRIAVGDAAKQLKDIADMVTHRLGGRGAVREVIEAVLNAQGRWEQSAAVFIDRQKRRKEGTPWRAQ
jgi:3-deoxy-D-manno-octulosonate 8-phosphate phosphatase (KDO 8-P phosphatase)